MFSNLKFFKKAQTKNNIFVSMLLEIIVLLEVYNFFMHVAIICSWSGETF